MFLRSEGEKEKAWMDGDMKCQCMQVGVQNVQAVQDESQKI
jgi:hypothetical protein